jgi:hypothetical protein
MAEGRDLELDLAEELVDDSGALEQGVQVSQSTVVTETLTH